MTNNFCQVSCSLGVDFLLKETKEREKQEAMESSEEAKGATSVYSPGDSASYSSLSRYISGANGCSPLFTTTNPSIHQEHHIRIRIIAQEHHIRIRIRAHEHRIRIRIRAQEHHI